MENFEFDAHKNFEQLRMGLVEYAYGVLMMSEDDALKAFEDFVHSRGYGFNEKILPEDRNLGIELVAGRCWMCLRHPFRDPVTAWKVFGARMAVKEYYLTHRNLTPKGTAKASQPLSGPYWVAMHDVLTMEVLFPWLSVDDFTGCCKRGDGLEYVAPSFWIDDVMVEDFRKLNEGSNPRRELQLKIRTVWTQSEAKKRPSTHNERKKEFRELIDKFLPGFVETSEMSREEFKEWLRVRSESL